MRINRGTFMKIFGKCTFSLFMIVSVAVGCLAQVESATEQRVEISFAGRLAGKPFACGSEYEGVGSKKSTVTPQDLRFFVSKLEVLDATGAAVPVTLEQDGIWQYQALALIDLEDGTGGCRNGNSAMHAVVTGSVPPGQYTGLRFTVGVPFDLDHGDTVSAPSPLNMTAMFWNWQGGYKFIRAEVALASKVDASRKEAAAASSARTDRMRSSGFPVHIGSTGCAGSEPTRAPTHECKHPNMVLVTLPQFDPAKDVVILDLGKLLEGSDISVNSPHSAPGCMSAENDPDCTTVMKALGLPYGKDPGGAQTVFYREPK